ncbi:MAG: hypothetical protein IPL54_11665 [Chitinophagaceae bacterium]|nr:hypothetical protein [Chitinophagaceae bacterium]
MKSFTAVQLLQDWHYDRKRNKVYSNIKEMILFVKKMIMKLCRFCDSFSGRISRVLPVKQNEIIP